MIYSLQLSTGRFGRRAENKLNLNWTALVGHLLCCRLSSTFLDVRARAACLLPTNILCLKTNQYPKSQAQENICHKILNITKCLLPTNILCLRTNQYPTSRAQENNPSRYLSKNVLFLNIHVSNKKEKLKSDVFFIGGMEGCWRSRGSHEGSSPQELVSGEWKYSMQMINMNKTLKSLLGSKS